MIVGNLDLPEGKYCSDWNAYPKAASRIMFLAETGSSVYGTSSAEGGDLDYVGISLMPANEVLGLRPFSSLVWRTTEEGKRSRAGDIDLSIYSFRKFVDLASAGNPSILVSLFTPPERAYSTRSGDELLKFSENFVTKSAGRRFLGYMDAQRKRMEDSRAGLRAPRSNRPELVAKFGYDTKFAMHMLRLGVQGCEFLTEGRISLPVPGKDGEMLRAVRDGRYSYEEVMSVATDLEEELRETLRSANVPEHADWQKVDDFLTHVHIEAWSDGAL